MQGNSFCRASQKDTSRNNENALTIRNSKEIRAALKTYDSLEAHRATALVLKDFRTTRVCCGQRNGTK